MTGAHRPRKGRVLDFYEGADGPIVPAPTTAPFPVLAAHGSRYGPRQIGRYEYDDDHLSSVELEYRSPGEEDVWVMSVHTHEVAEDAFLRPTTQSLLDYRVTARSVGDDAELLKVPESISVAGEDIDVEFRRYESLDIAVLEVPGKRVIVVVERSRDAADRRVELAVIEPGRPLAATG